MANLFLSLPAPVGNGSGLAVNTSAMGRIKTIVVGGTLKGAVNVEVANDAAGVEYASVGTFNTRGSLTLTMAAHWMRITVTGYVSGSPVVAVGADDSSGDYADLPVTAGDGVGAPVDISALGPDVSVVVANAFTGGLTAEVSVDGAEYVPALSFNAPDVQSFHGYAAWMRIRRTGTNGGAVPAVAVGAT